MNQKISIMMWWDYESEIKKMSCHHVESMMEERQLRCALAIIISEDGPATLSS